MPRTRLAFTAALVLDALGAGAALLIALRPWQTVTTPRPAPLHDDTLHLSGRTVDAAPTAFALVALAGVVAVIATRGIVRRIVGVVLAVSGAGILWRSTVSAAAVSTSRARSLVTEHHSSVVVTGARPHVSVAPLWPAASAVAGVLVLVGGVLVAWQGHLWSTMSARYESPQPAVDDDADARERSRQRAAATLWTALDRGEDPTDATDADRSG